FALLWEVINTVSREAPVQVAGLRKSVWESFAQEPAGYIPWALFLENAVLSVGATLATYAPVALVIRSRQGERDWLDRGGLVFGLLWIAACIVHRLSLVSTSIVGYLR